MLVELIINILIRSIKIIFSTNDTDDDSEMKLKYEIAEFMVKMGSSREAYSLNEDRSQITSKTKNDDHNYCKQKLQFIEISDDKIEINNQVQIEKTQQKNDLQFIKETDKSELVNPKYDLPNPSTDQKNLQYIRNNQMITKEKKSNDFTKEKFTYVSKKIL
ncbi:hypothetical protein A0H76_2235 [Hepatospora eriocheir]|uniref:Uncharacterized protein n=1 Tax=Hepatospora eriocheir TaxID=1081669 RepID=A0A1X0QFS9_9MICR|nr:hypothetical protein A0H76_2235 [Hepatospora eriocheir]